MYAMCCYKLMYFGLGEEKLLDEGAGGKAFDVYELLEYMQCVCRIENTVKYVIHCVCIICQL